MEPRSWNHEQPGMALVVVLMVLLAASAVAAGASMVGSNAWIIHQYGERQSILESAADAGLEEARARLNAEPDIFPDSGYAVLESESDIRDAAGQVIPGVQRTTYLGPTGTTTGQYGVFGSIVSVASDGRNRVVRRTELTEESFAKFAYFTDVEPSNIAFGSGDQIYGPVHSNDQIKIYDTRATFHGPVTTAQTVKDARYGTFRQGYEQRVERIDMPDIADLDRLRGYATEGGMAFVNNTVGTPSQSMMRIEFDTIDGYGFVKIYKAHNSNNAYWVTATVPSNYNSRGLRDSPNCGHFHTSGGGRGGRTFVAAADHTATRGSDTWTQSITNDGQCFLGGSDSIFGEFRADDGRGAWQKNMAGSTWVARNAGRADSVYLFPINRELNPGFKGVIHVTGKVAISGVVRGQVTVAATDDIIIADNLEYAIDPGDPARNCDDGDDTTHDIAGLVAGGDILVAENTINAPVRPSNSGSNWLTLGSTTHETIHATLLTLGVFKVHNHDQGSTNAQSCEGITRGRGCLYVVGGIIQRQRGAVGTSLTSGGGRGNVKRYSYDQCVLSNPPPYFPTTGEFSRGRYFEIDPANFNINRLFEQLTSQ